MKLLFISRYFPDMFGGVSDYTYHLSRVLAEKGEEVYVLTSKDERVIKDTGNNVKVLPVVKKWGFRGIPLIIREVKKANPDWVGLQYEPYMYNKYGIPIHITFLCGILRLSGFKILTTFHEVAIRFNIKKPKYWMTAILQRIIAYTICLFSNKIVVTIEYFSKMLQPFRNKILRIPVGSSVEPYDISEKDKKLLCEKIANGEKFIISTFGSGAPWRRSDILLKAIRNYLDNDGAKDLKLLIIGKNSEDKNLTHLIRELNLESVVYRTGYLIRDEIYKYLKISDLFVLIDTDAYGGVSTKSTSLASAYAAKLPILANKGILTDNFFKHRINIFLINNPDIAELVSAISELINNSKLLEELKRGSEETYNNFLTWYNIGDKYKDILNEIN